MSVFSFGRVSNLLGGVARYAGFFVVALTMVLPAPSVRAAGLEISVDKASAMPGEEIIVTAKFNYAPDSVFDDTNPADGVDDDNIFGFNFYLYYDDSVFEWDDTFGDLTPYLKELIPGNWFLSVADPDLDARGPYINATARGFLFAPNLCNIGYAQFGDHPACATTSTEADSLLVPGLNDVFQFKAKIKAGATPGAYDLDLSDTLAGGGKASSLINTGAIVLENTTSGATTITVVGDTFVPILESFTSTELDGTYHSTDTINVTATFDENLKEPYANTMEVVMDDGLGTTITLTDGDDGDNVLTGTYTVPAGAFNTDLDVLSINSMDVSDASDNVSTATTMPGAGNNISDTSDIIVDALQLVIEFLDVTAGANENFGYSATDIVVSGGNNTGGDSRTIDVYDTAGGTATGGGTDYTFAAPETLIIPAGDYSTPQTLTTLFTGPSVTGETLVEANETIVLGFQNPGSDIVAGDADGVGGAETVHTYSILNDDTTTLTFDDPNGDEDTGAITVTVTSSAVVDGGFTIDVSTVDDTATLADSDYTQISGQTLTFAGTPGETQTFTVTPTMDINLESNETLTVSFDGGSVTAGTVDTSDVIISDTGTVTINNDDSAEVTITNVAVNEDTGTLTFVATLDNVVSGGVDVDFSTADGTATSADSDYTSLVNQTVTFAGTANETQNVAVTLGVDTKLESNETFAISMSNVTNPGVTITDTAQGTITNDDSAEVTIANESGSENGGALTFTATLDNAVQGGFNVEVSTADGTATTADSDYSAVSSQLLTFTGTASETKTFNVTPTDDTKVETDETYTVSMANVSNAGVTITDTAQGTITNDDSAIVMIADNSGAENGGNISFTATLDVVVDGGFTVEVSTADGTATIADSDYGAVAAQVLTFSGTASETQDFTISPTNDNKVEAYETFTVSMANAVASTVDPADITITDTAQGTITNDDLATVTIDNESGNEDDGNITFTATVDNAVDGGFTIEVSTADGTAKLTDSDYTQVSGQVVIFTGNASETQTFNILPTVDTNLESDETFTVSMANAVASTVDPADITITDTAQGTITNDDGLVVTIADVSDDEDTGAITVTLVLSDVVVGGFDVDVSTADGTATVADGDYIPLVNNTVTFVGTAGENQTVTLSPASDSKVEGDETVIISMSNVTEPGVTITDTAVVTINNDDTANITIDDVVGAEDSGAMAFTATLDVAVQDGVTVDVSTVDGTATSGDSDYTPVVNQLLSFVGTVGETQTFTVTPTVDAKVEANETFTIAQSNVSNTDVVITDTATGTINNDDTATVTIAGNNGGEEAGPITFTATLDNAVQGGFTVEVSTADNTAVSPADYSTVSAQALTFVGIAGETQIFTVTPASDTDVEGPEMFDISMANLGATSLVVDITDTAVGTINDDDSASVNIDDPTVNEEDGTITFTLTLDQNVVGGFTLEASTSDGTAAAGSDYTATSSQVVTFGGTAGETQTVVITIADEAIVEGNETLTLSMANSSESLVDVTDTGTGTITNTDTANITIDDVVGAEDSGTMTFTATLDQAVQGGLTVEVSTIDGSATVGDSDYTALSSQVVTFVGAVGETQPITVTVGVETAVEPDETFTVTMANPSVSAVTVTDTALGTIQNDDTAAVTIADNNGNEDSGPITFTATLDNAVSGGFTIDVSTADGTATIADSDYTPIVNQTLTFTGNPGETQMFTVTPTSDTNAEGNETFTISMSNLAGTSATVDVADTAVGTINEDDAAEVTISDVSQNEDAGNMTFTLTLDNNVVEGFTVDVSTSDGTATAGSDYTAVSSQVVTFGGTLGETQTVDVPVNADTIVESDEMFTVGMSNLGGTALIVTISDTATGTVQNDDSAEITIADANADEDTGNLTLVATLDNAVQDGFTVEVSTADGTAIAGTDYTALSSQVLTFIGTAGETQNIVVPMTVDTIVEVNEIFTVSMANVSDPTNITITDTAIGTINNDDTANVTIADVSGNEDDGAMTFMATLNGGVDGGFTVDVSTADGTATVADSDYTSITNQTLTFAGTVSETQNFTVTPTIDTTPEFNETFTISMSNLAGTAFTVDVSDTATGTIVNDDVEPVLTVGDVTVAENGPPTTLTVTLDVAVAGGFTVEVEADGGTATEGTDYQTIDAEVLTFVGTPGETQTLTFTPINDTTYEGDETVTIKLQNPSEVVDVTDTATVTITEDDSEPETPSAGTVTVEFYKKKVSESEDKEHPEVYLYVKGADLTGEDDQSVKVDIVPGGDAKGDGEDFKFDDPETIKIKAQDYTDGKKIDIDLYIEDDSDYEDDEKIRFTLKSPSELVVIGDADGKDGTEDDMEFIIENNDDKPKEEEKDEEKQVPAPSGTYSPTTYEKENEEGTKEVEFYEPTPSPRPSTNPEDLDIDDDRMVGEDGDTAVLNPDEAKLAGGAEEAGSTVEITDENGEVVCSTTVDAQGRWNCDLSSQEDGTKKLKISVKNENGEERTYEVSVTFDRVAPSKPVVISPVNLDVVAQKRPIFKGNGSEIGARIRVFLKDRQMGEQGAVLINTARAATTDADLLCETIVKSDLAWECQSTKQFNEGEQITVQVAQADLAGNEGEPVDLKFSIEKAVMEDIEKKTTNWWLYIIPIIIILLIIVGYLMMRDDNEKQV